MGDGPESAGVLGGACPRPAAVEAAEGLGHAAAVDRGGVFADPVGGQAEDVGPLARVLSHVVGGFLWS